MRRPSVVLFLAWGSCLASKQHEKQKFSYEDETWLQVPGYWGKPNPHSAYQEMDETVCGCRYQCIQFPTCSAARYRLSDKKCFIHTNEDTFELIKDEDHLLFFNAGNYPDVANQFNFEEKNIALNKKSKGTPGDTENNLPATNAVDGDLNTYYKSVSNIGGTSYMVLDLGTTQSVTMTRIITINYEEGEVRRKRFKDIEVRISNQTGRDPKNYQSGKVIMQIPTYSDSTEQRLEPPVVGRYVVVVRKSDESENILEIAELEVFIKLPTIIL